MPPRARPKTTPAPERPPLLGALLRNARRRVLADVFTRLGEQGFDDVRDVHMAVFQYPGPEGASPLELARRAQMSKQAMNQLLGTLERAGYLVRRDDPQHPKQRQVRLTARGTRLLELIRSAVRRVERDAMQRLGPERFTIMLECLRELAGE